MHLQGKDALGCRLPREIGPAQGRKVGVGLDHAFPTGGQKRVPFLGPLQEGYSRVPLPTTLDAKSQRATHSRSVMYTPRKVADPNDPMGPGVFHADDGSTYVYSMDDLIGGGHFARVFKARKQDDPTKYIAVKRHLFTLGMGDEPGALKLLGRYLGENPEGSLIGMPFYQGKTLAWHLDQASLTPAQRSELFQLVNAKVVALHKLGWAHRDLKPENIMILDGNKVLFLARKSCDVTRSFVGC